MYGRGNRIRSTGLYAAVISGVAAFAGGASWLGGEVVKGTYGPEQAKEYVEQSGYTDVELTDTDSMFVPVRGCGKDDSVKYEFDATSQAGQEVGVVVCKGLFKGATIRQG